MKIEILSITMGDIQSGQGFYERQQEGLGAYFLVFWIRCFLILMRCCYMPACTSNFSAVTAHSLNGSPMRFTIG